MTGSSLLSRPPFRDLDSAASVGGEPNLFFDPTIAASCSVSGARLVGEIRIDNPDELERLLDIRGAPDPLLFISAFRKWGLDCFDRIEGDFAVAIWDESERRLILARDAIGQRPLFYRQIGSGIVFASLPVQLAALVGTPAADLVHMVSALAFMPNLGSRSSIEGVSRVRPGHAVVLGQSGPVSEVAWWNPDLSPLRIGREEAVDAMASQLGKTIAAMVRSDAPLIASDLSGGLDSSIVVATAAGIIDDRSRLLALTGISSGPADSPERLFADESGHASQTAAVNHVRHQTVGVGPQSPFAALDRWLPTVQEPIANACNLGWIDGCYAAARAAGADVYLTGGRGNFTVTRYGMGRFAELARSGRMITLARELRSYRAFAGGSWPGLLAMSFGPWVPDVMWNALVPARHRRHDGIDLATLMLRDGPEARAAVDELAQEGVDDIDAVFADERPMARWMAARSIDDGVGNLSVRRRHGLEIREPLSAKRVVELCLRLPTAAYFHAGRPRALARDLLRGKAPASVVNETRRGWQGANWRAGFEPVRAEMAAELNRVRDDSALARVIDVEQAKAVLSAWPKEGWNRVDQLSLYRSTLFPLIGAARFARFVREWNPA